MKIMQKNHCKTTIARNMKKKKQSGEGKGTDKYPGRH
jgi:hypothetical protein